MSVEKSRLRGYRRGIPYRKGNVTENDFLSEFKFKGVKFNNEYTEAEKRYYLNNTFDALKDLSMILNVSPETLSLLNKNGEKPDLVFGKTDKSYSNLVISKGGNIAQTWIKYLDAFIGNSVGLSDGLCNFILSYPISDSDVCVEKLKSLLNTLKYKEKVINEMDITSDRLEEYRDRLSELLNNMPFKERDDYNKIAVIEDSRAKFIKELSPESLEYMLFMFTSNGLFLGDLKEEVTNLFDLVEKEKSDLIRDVKKDAIVQTDFYKSVKSLNGDDLYLFEKAVNSYVSYKLKELSAYNNFLVDYNEENVIISDEESLIFYPEIEKFFIEVLPVISEKVHIEPEEEEIVESLDETTVESNIERVLAQDKGKFKLTLFKKLAKEAGFKVSQSKTEKIADSTIYLIDFEGSYIKYIKPHIFNNPSETGHCINIYCGESGDTKQGYWWDNELNYTDLVHFLSEIEETAKQEAIKKIEKNKFKLTWFKDTCIKVGLKADKLESPVVNNRYVIAFKNNYIQYVYAPVYLKVDDEKEQFIKIKTLREEIYHTWKGELVYKDLIIKMKEIEKQGNMILEEEAIKLKEKFEKEKAETLNKIENVKKEYNKHILRQKEEFNSIINCEGLRDTKELRDKMLKYIAFKQYHLNYPSNFDNVRSVLQNNVFEKDGIQFIVEQAIIPEKSLKGKSKAWTSILNSHIKIQRRAEDKKQLEALIESFVEMKLLSKNYSKTQKQMYSEALTFMLCKVCDLDVRTYCNSQIFEKFVHSGDANISGYLNRSFKLFDSLLVYFV